MAMGSLTTQLVENQHTVFDFGQHLYQRDQTLVHGGYHFLCVCKHTLDLWRNDRNATQYDTHQNHLDDQHCAHASVQHVDGAGMCDDLRTKHRFFHGCTQRLDSYNKIRICVEYLIGVRTVIYLCPHPEVVFLEAAGLGEKGIRTPCALGGSCWFAPTRDTCDASEATCGNATSTTTSEF